MQAANLTWTEANLRRYLADPAGVVPGTMMPPPGLAPAQMTEVVNYLKTL
jgi:cytochrome c2